MTQKETVSKPFVPVTIEVHLSLRHKKQTDAVFGPLWLPHLQKRLLGIMGD
jgi:hypothetical protein